MILHQLRDLYDRKRDDVEAWLASVRAEAAPYLTTSVDLRHSGARLVPVDTNLYPAGFQNVSAHGRKRASAQFKSGIAVVNASASRVLIFPEAHTRNVPYFENLAALKSIIMAAGFDVEIASLADTTEITTPSGQVFTQHKLVRVGDMLSTESGFTPDVIVLNNDCTAGVPPLLQGLAQPVLPPVHKGWYNRLKSSHFEAYAAIAGQFAQQFGLDPWTICAEFKAIKGVNFKTREGAEMLAAEVDALLARVAEKHAAYGITTPPYAYVKADSGTYGMGILVVQSGADILEMNKKERNKMHVIKEGMEVHNVVIQEGIPTTDVVDEKPAEPMIYMVDGVPIGGMYRINGNRDALGNLNAAGMEFKGMCEEMDATPCRQKIAECDFRAFGLVAALAALAAAREPTT